MPPDMTAKKRPNPIRITPTKDRPGGGRLVRVAVLVGGQEPLSLLLPLPVDALQLG